MYYIVFLFLLLLYLIRDIINKKSYMLLSFISLSMIIIFRFGVGADYFSYRYIYEFLNIENLNLFFREFSNIELLYKLMMLPFIKIGIPFHAFFVITNLIILLFFYLWILENSNDVALSVLLFYSMFYFVWVLSAVRQGLVISIGLYLFLSKNRKLSFLASLVSIFLLSLIHTTALFFIVLLLMKRIKWSKKIHLRLLLIGLLFSFFPFDKILAPFTFIESIDWLLVIYNKRTSLIGISTFMRIVFFIIFFYFYDYLAIEEDNKDYIDYFLVGISLYFFLKFSEILASRITIFTFILCIIIIPDLFNFIISILFSYRPKIKKLMTLSLFALSFMYLEKELLTMTHQVGMRTENKFIRMTTIINPKIDHFNTKYSVILNQKEKWMKVKNDFEIPIETMEYTEKSQYALITQNNNSGLEYGIISDNHKWLRELESIQNVKSVELVGDVLLVKKNKNIFEYVEFEDLTLQNRSENKMRGEVRNHLSKKYLSNGFDERIISLNDEQIDSIISEFYQSPKKVEPIAFSRIRHGSEYYHILHIQFNGEHQYIYLDENFTSIFDNVILNSEKFDVQGFGVFDTYAGSFIGNKDGEIVWWENYE